MAGKKKNITVVADDDQAIYRWRGAALSNIMQFKNNFPGAKIITLTSNYRSTQEILDRSHQLIQKNNPNRLEVAENINKKLISERKLKGDPIEFINADRVEEEADEIAKKIKNLTKKYDFKDIAILIRANSHSQPITHALERHKIPYQFLGPSHLFNQDEIKDLISYFRVLYNLSDSISMYRILNMDIFGIPPRDINSLLNLARKRGISLFEMLEKSDETFISQDTKEKAKKLTSMILRHLELIKKDKPGQILYYFLVDSGLYKKYLDIKNERVQIEATNIAKFFDKIKTYETLNQDVSVYTIVDWIDLMMELGDNPIIGGMDFKNTNAVNILTVHSSKGLEFPVVFMVNLVSDRFPTRERAEKIPIPDQLVKEILPEGNYHTEEERRLFYVGMTRAKDQLIFTSAQFYADGKREKKISPFVYEALPELLDGKVHGKPTKQLSFLQATSEYKNNEKIPETKNIDGVNIQSISYSQLQTFDTCPLHYKAKYLLNLPSEITSSLSFGITIHNTFKEFYELAKTDPKITFKDFQTILSKNWISEGYQRKEYENLYRREGDKIIKNYFQNIFNPKHLPIALEKPFSFHIQKDKNDILRVGGKIDRIDKISENEIEIIDYKTGSLDKALKNNYETQLGIYALAALKMENGFLQKSFKKIKTTLLYLQEEKENRISQEFTLEDLKQIENKILNKVKEIETSDFKCNGGFLCQPKYCEYKMLCTSV